MREPPVVNVVNFWRFSYDEHTSLSLFRTGSRQHAEALMFVVSAVLLVSLFSLISLPVCVLGVLSLG